MFIQVNIRSVISKFQIANELVPRGCLCIYFIPILVAKHSFYHQIQSVIGRFTVVDEWRTDAIVSLNDKWRHKIAIGELTCWESSF